jgi:hypothetical protein
MTNVQTQEIVRDTTRLQEESLTNFMAAIGYEPVYHDRIGLCGFYQPKFNCTGEPRVSVNRAIRMHNDAADEVFAKLVFQPYTDFTTFVTDYHNIDDITVLFAGTCKIVQRINATFSRKRGFEVHKHYVKFSTRRDARQYGF